MSQSTRKKHTRKRIEDAAIQCFSTRSFSNVTMDEIAENAGITKRTLYKYFPSKAALIASIFEKKLKELYIQEELALQQCASAEEVIHTQFMVLNSFTKNNFEFMKMFWSLKDNIDNGEVPDETLARIITLNYKLIDMPASYIASKEFSGLLSSYSPEMIIHYISAINKGLFLQCDKEDKLRLKSPTLEKLTEFALDCLLNCL